MSTTVPSVLRRWVIPSGAALAVVAGGVAIGLVTNAADRSLTPRSADELIADLLTAHPDGLQGTATIRADLGLPPLPIPSAGTADLGSLAAGTHTLRVWYASPGQARVALVGQEGESDVVVNRTDLWIWSSKENTATHRSVAEGSSLLDLLGQGGIAAVLGGLSGLTGGVDIGGAATGTASPLPSAGGGLDPAALGKLALTFLQSSTDVQTTNDARVAGRPVYELVLKPRDTGSLIDSVVLAIDAEQKVPLRFAINTRAGDTPAIEVAFTQIAFTRPDASEFTFDPPPGATVDEEEPSATGPDSAPGSDAIPTKPAIPPGADVILPPSGSDSQHAVVGSGWTTVLVLKAPDLTELAGADAAKLLALLPKVSGAWGSGTLLQTNLVSVLLTDDGRLLVGAVSPDRLEAAAADPAATLHP